MDPISALPNDVITHIFSFLPFKDVVETSFLSRRWRYTWTTTTPHLEFDGLWHRNHEPPYSGFPSFSSLVDEVLRQCASAPVTKFHITHFSEADGRELDLLLRFAEEHRVEDLRLRLANDPPFFYKLPPFLYCLSRLVRLEVSACCFWLVGATEISWPRLKILSMEDVELSDDILGRILKGSPVLESLTLARSEFELDEESDEESEDRVNFEEEELSCLRKGNLECLAKHLKRVEIIGIGADSFGSDRQLALIKFLLGDALVLEKLVIKVKLPTLFVPCKLLGASENVRSFPKASENAEVIFDWCTRRSI